MTPGSEKVDQMLARASLETPVPPEAVDRISAAILPGLRPVRPISSTPVRVAGLLLSGAVVALAGAALFGMNGIRKLDGLESFAIFAILVLFGGLAAGQSAAEMVPGARRIASPSVLLCAGSTALLAIFALLFQGYGMDGFVRQGVPCLRAGLLLAAPAAGGAWLILRRGMALDATAAGLAAGTLAGIAGIAMLELHCGILRAVHVMVWHVAVVPVSALVGAWLAKVFTSRS